MGIKGLWTVLSPFSEKKSLHEIRGQTLAVDLSGWVCDSQNVTDYHIQPKLYLRNLFFRTIYLLLADVNPIFVLEGDAPELKRDVMATRNALQFRGAAPRHEPAKKTPDVSRKRFRGVLQECEALLNCMGVRCIKGRGEAEATCAEMNAQDAVVSQDSDCFAYGARRVYRNFSVSNSAGGGALQGSIDCYDADTMFRNNGFGRNKMIALALLCGCDYGAGACGSSITTALSFLHTVPEADIIPRLLSWVTDPEYYEDKSRWVAVPGRCDRCGHVGRSHAKKGCPVCATHSSCVDHGHKSKVAEVKRELSLRTRALSCGMPFPEPLVMKEFHNSTPEKIDTDALKTPVPSLIKFVKLMKAKLDWSERYCVTKFLPLLTKWHLQDNVPTRTIKPLTIKKKRNPRGVPSYEVVWGDINDLYQGLISDDQFEDDEDPLMVWTTTERQDLMLRYYPEVVEAFEESIKKPPKEKKFRAKKKTDNVTSTKTKRNHVRNVKHLADNIEQLSDSLKAVNLSGVNAKIIDNDRAAELNSSVANVSVKVNRLKRKLKNNAKGKGQKTIESFLASKKRKTSNKAIKRLRQSFKNMSTNNEKIVNSGKSSVICIDIDKENHIKDNFLSMFDTSVQDIHESDLSDIVDKIVKRKADTRTARVNDNLVNLVFDKCVTPRKSLFRKSVLNEIYNNCSTPKDSPKVSVTNRFSVNTSYFFDKLTEKCDAFEQSVDYKYNNHFECETTVDYSLPDVCL